MNRWQSLARHQCYFQIKGVCDGDQAGQPQVNATGFDARYLCLRHTGKLAQDALAQILGLSCLSQPFGYGLGAVVHLISLSTSSWLDDIEYYINTAMTHSALCVRGVPGSWMAGTSIDIILRIKLDIGYRFTRVEGGRMWGWDASDAAAGGRGAQSFDNGFNTHSVRAGLCVALW